MKKISVIMFFVMASLGYSFAQDGSLQARGERKTLEERVEIRTNKMVGELALTPEQAAKLKEIHLKQAEKMKAMREKQAAENQMFRQEAQAITTETERQYETVLTPEQLEKYKQSKAQNADGKRNRHKELRKRSKR